MVAEPDRVPEIQAVCAKWELSATPIGQVTDDGIFRVRHDGRVVAAIPGQRLVDDCPIYHPEAREGDAARGAGAPRARRGRPGADLHGALAAAARCAQPRQQALGLRAVRFHRAGVDRARARRRRGRAPGAGHRVRARRHGRLQHPLGRARSLRGRQGDGRRGGPQHRLHRRPAPRHHRLPQLRQPGKARGLLPVPRGLPRHRRRLPGVRHPGDRRQRLLLQREPDRRDRSHADRRHGRAARPRGRPGAAAISPRRATDRDPAAPPAASWAAPPTGPSCFDFVGGRAAAGRPGGGARLQQLLVAAARSRLLRSAHDCVRRGLAVALAEAAIGGPYAAGAASAPASTFGPTRRSVPAEGVLYGEDGARAVVSTSPADVAALPGARRRARRAGSSARARSASATAALELRVGPEAVHLVHRRICGGPISRDSPADAASGRGPLGGRVRHVRHHRRLRDPGRGPAHLPRPLRPAAPGPGERRHRRHRSRRAIAGSHRGMGLVGENFEESILADPAGRRRRRPHPLLHHRQHRARERPAVPRRHPRRPARHRAQRQPDQRRGAQARAGGEGRHLHHLVRHRGDRAPDRAVARPTRSRTRSATRWRRWTARTAW